MATEGVGLLGHPVLWQEVLVPVQDHLVGINRAMGSDIPVGERLYGTERTLSAGVIFSF